MGAVNTYLAVHGRHRCGGGRRRGFTFRATEVSEGRGSRHGRTEDEREDGDVLHILFCSSFLLSLFLLQFELFYFVLMDNEYYAYVMYARKKFR